MTPDKDLEQRQQAARTHGAYAIQARGEEALTDEQRPLLVELREKVQDRDGVLELMKEHAAKAVLIANLMTSYAVEKHQAGVPLEDIAVLGKLPAFYNTAQRALKDLISELPQAAPGTNELARIKQVIDDYAER